MSEGLLILLQFSLGVYVYLQEPAFGPPPPQQIGDSENI